MTPHLTPHTSHLTPFTKMHGLGNDFVIFDAREKPLPAFDFAAIANRHTGIGCDQVIVLEPSSVAHAAMRIINADGSEVEACGNATRCAAWLLEQETITLETAAGILTTHRSGDQQVTVEMGLPHFAARTLPFPENPAELSIGNPHLVFFVPDVTAIDVAGLGAAYETHPAFPQRTNVEWVEITSPNHLKMRVWERGVGITQACGTGACASAASAMQRGLCHRRVEVEMPGGSLMIDWPTDDKPLLMQGPVCVSFTGFTEL